MGRGCVCRKSLADGCTQSEREREREKEGERGGGWDAHIRARTRGRMEGARYTDSPHSLIALSAAHSFYLSLSLSLSLSSLYIYIYIYLPPSSRYLPYTRAYTGVEGRRRATCLTHRLSLALIALPARNLTLPSLFAFPLTHRSTCLAHRLSLPSSLSLPLIALPALYTDSPLSISALSPALSALSPDGPPDRPPHPPARPPSP